MAEGPIIRPREGHGQGATPMSTGAGHESPAGSGRRAGAPASKSKGEERCESCGKQLTPGNSTLFKGFCDECAQKNARSMFF